MCELGIAFSKLHRFDADNWQRFRAFSLTSRAPCWVDGETAVWDLLAIAECLAERHVTVWPSDASARAGTLVENLRA